MTEKLITKISGIMEEIEVLKFLFIPTRGQQLSWFNMAFLVSYKMLDLCSRL